MAERLICFISCVFCAVPFLAISLLKRNSNDPIGFWSGDDSLKNKIKDVRNIMRKWQYYTGISA